MSPIPFATSATLTASLAQDSTAALSAKLISTSIKALATQLVLPI